MARRQFKIPFAATGDTVSIPETTQPDGSVSMQQGYGFDYQRDPQTDPLAKTFPRDVHNGLMNEITASIGEIQQNGYPIWVAEGSPYPVNAVVRHNGQNWQSRIANNNSQPGVDSNWSEAFATVVQSTGTSTTSVMSQKAVTDKFDSLGTASTRDVQTSPTDTTDGALMAVGAFGWNGGNVIPLPPSADTKSLTTPGVYILAGGGIDTPPNIASPYIQVFKHATPDYIKLIAYDLAGDGCAVRTCFSGNWGGWREFYHTGNVTPFAQTLLDDADAAAARGTLGINLPIGDGQTWQDVTGSRVVNTNYTNSTGRSIAISVITGAGDSQDFDLKVNGLLVGRAFIGSSSGNYISTLFSIIPPGAVYRIDQISTGIPAGWMELR